MQVFNRVNFDSAVRALQEGEIVAVPTETVYGLAVKVDNISAINKLLELKDRGIESGKCLTMMVANTHEIAKYAQLTQQTHNLALRHFPGELTLILPKNKKFKHEYFDHFKKIGIRIPKHKAMLNLIKQTGPLLVTSANPKGEAPCMSLKEIEERLPSIEYGLTGECGHSLPSTIIDFAKEEPEVIRQGGLLIVHY